MRTLEHRSNNAYDTILLVENGKAVAKWMTDKKDKVFSDYSKPGDLDNWDAHYLDDDNPDDYGDLVSRTYNYVTIHSSGDGRLIAVDEQGNEVASIHCNEPVTAGTNSDIVEQMGYVETVEHDKENMTAYGFCPYAEVKP